MIILPQSYISGHAYLAGHYCIFNMISLPWLELHLWPGYYCCFNIYGILVLVNTCRRCMECDLDCKVKSQLWKMCLLAVVVIEGSWVGLGVGGVPRLTSNPIEKVNSTWISIYWYMDISSSTHWNCIGTLIVGQVKNGFTETISSPLEFILAGRKADNWTVQWWATITDK